MSKNAETRWVRKFRKRSPIIILSLVVISLLLNFWMSFQGNSVLALLNQVLIEKNKSRVYLATGMDAFLAKAAPSGNVVLKFKRFPNPKKEHDGAVPLLIYFRTVYDLYPRRVFAVPPNVVVNTEEDLAAHPFNPDIDWMRKNDIRKVITLTRTENDSIYTKVEDIHPLSSKTSPKIINAGENR